MGKDGGCSTDLSVSSKTSSRAILVRRDEVRPLSSEFTPETERQRIQQLVGALSGGGCGCSPSSWGQLDKFPLCNWSSCSPPEFFFAHISFLKIYPFL